MDTFDRIIKPLSVRYKSAEYIEVKRPVGIENYQEVSNTLLLVEKGTLYYGQDKQKVQAGDILFIPPKPTYLQYGDTSERILYFQFQEQQSGYLRRLEEDQRASEAIQFKALYIETKVFDAIDLFTSFDIPPFIIHDKESIPHLIHNLVAEALHNHIGKDKVLSSLSFELIIRILRYIQKENLFAQEIATSSSNLRDPRLVRLFQHINNHLSEDLSNKQLAEVVNVSGDYIGQYFKTLTGINPQDYIEFQRMQKAVTLLRETGYNISDVGRKVGYKDSSYFCRRFKIMFGISAGRMRRREVAARAAA